MSATGAQIGEWLGVPAPHTDAEVFALLQGRLELTAIDRLLHLGFERKEIDALILPLRTLQHRRTRGERLTVDESDRVLRLLGVLSLAEEVYSGRERALRWLRRANPRLDGHVPMMLLKTGVGCHMVEQLLVQIDEGMII
jgi:putative toxin-antitoxin system antitoxin component (TIGR02293 family)